jgi:hypothetical protein
MFIYIDIYIYTIMIIVYDMSIAIYDVPCFCDMITGEVLPASPLRQAPVPLPAPKMALPGHAESYNPPSEYLFTEDRWPTVVMFDECS